MRLGDLADAGWTVSGPDKEADGQTWVHIEKPFANPDELNEILDEINGPSGPVGDFELTITEAWDETTWQLTGTAGLTGGVATFVDAELAGAFGTARPLEDLVAESGDPDRRGPQPDGHRDDAATRRHPSSCECRSTAAPCPSKPPAVRPTTACGSRRSWRACAGPCSPDGSPTG